MSDIKRPRTMTLHDALKIGYLRDEKKQKNALKRFGYRLDTDLTNREHLTAYDPVQKKLLFVSNGTQPTSLKDIGTDIALAFGGLKSTARYRDDKRAFNAATAKYDEDKAVVLGHSLGGVISSGIARGKDQVYTLNKAATVGAQTRKNEKAFRIEGDIVSALGSGIKTIRNPTLGREVPVLGPHAIDKIKKLPIVV